MFEYLSKHNRIVVVGSPRSGTNITAKMIGHDLCYQYFNDQIFGLWDVEKFGILFIKDILPDKFVLQAPAMTRFCHCLPEDVAVVFCKRKHEDIERSMKRIRWKGSLGFHILYGDFNRDFSSSVVPTIYALWEEQKKLIHHWYEVEYESTRSHSLWLEKKDRTDDKWNESKAVYEAKT